jgi:hypothetical protein
MPKIILNSFPRPEDILIIPIPGKLFSRFFIKHLMGESIPPAEIEDVTDDEEVLLSAEELQVYVGGPPRDDRTTTIQDSFIKIPAPPDFRNVDELTNYETKL